MYQNVTICFSPLPRPLLITLLIQKFRRWICFLDVIYYPKISPDSYSSAEISIIIHQNQFLNLSMMVAHFINLDDHTCNGDPKILSY